MKGFEKKSRTFGFFHSRSKDRIDSNLACVYGVTMKRLNEQLRRDRKRFSGDFVLQVSAEEYEIPRSQIATLNERQAEAKSIRNES